MMLGKAVDEQSKDLGDGRRNSRQFVGHNSGRQEFATVPVE